LSIFVQDDLEAELADLEEQQMQEEMLETPAVPISAPTSKIPVARRMSLPFADSVNKKCNSRFQQLFPPKKRKKRIRSMPISKPSKPSLRSERNFNSIFPNTTALCLCRTAC
jgi:hypothetical protein